MSMVRAISRLVYNVRARMGLAKMAAHWRQAGAPLPQVTALQELHRRGILEEFRDFASNTYLETGGLVADIKEVWLAEKLKPHAGVLGLKTVKMLSQIVRDMPVSEMLHPGAYQTWCEQADSASKDVLTSAVRRCGTTLTHREARVLVGRSSS